MKKVGVKRKGISLVELSIVMFTIAVVTPAFFSQMRNAFYLYKQIQDKRIAEARITSVKAILKSPLLHCGIFMPSDAAEYKENFGSQSTQPFSWKGPISTGVKSASKNGYSIRIAYAKSSNYTVASAISTDIPSADVTFNEAIDSDDFSISSSGNKAQIKNWFFFANSYPRDITFNATKILDTHTLSLKNHISADIQICKNDRLYYFYAIECFETDGIFYTKNFRVSGDQPRVDGILLFDFTIDTAAKTVTCYIAARGDEKWPKRKIIGQELFPEEIAAKIPNKKYLIICSTLTVPLINYNR